MNLRTILGLFALLFVIQALFGCSTAELAGGKSSDGKVAPADGTRLQPGLDLLQRGMVSNLWTALSPAE